MAYSKATNPQNFLKKCKAGDIVSFKLKVSNPWMDKDVDITCDWRVIDIQPHKVKFGMTDINGISWQLISYDNSNMIIWAKRTVTGKPGFFYSQDLTVWFWYLVHSCQFIKMTPLQLK